MSHLPLKHAKWNELRLLVKFHPVELDFQALSPAGFTRLDPICRPAPPSWLFIAGLMSLFCVTSAIWLRRHLAPPAALGGAVVHLAVLFTLGGV